MNTVTITFLAAAVSSLALPSQTSPSPLLGSSLQPWSPPLLCVSAAHWLQSDLQLWEVRCGGEVWVSSEVVHDVWVSCVGVK